MSVLIPCWTDAAPDSKLIGGIRNYLGAHALKHRRVRTAAAFGFSHHTL